MSTLSIFDAAREVPERPALIADGLVVTYGEGAALAAHAHAWLAERGARVGDRVALVATATPETVFFLWALVEMGVTVVLLHPRLTDGERAALVSESSPSFVIDDAVSAFAEARRVPATAASGAPVDAEQILALLFTSGTTGRSKGAMLSRRAFVAAAHASAKNLGWRDEDRWLLCMPPAHVGGLSIVIRCLLARRTVVLAQGAGARFDPDAIRTDIERHEVTIASVVPTMLQRIFQAAPSWSGTSRLRAILLGGAGAPPKLIAASAERGLPVLTTYGLTEACSQVTTQKYGTPPSIEHGAGLPVDGMEVRIADDRIWVRGKSMMTGYFSASEQPAPFTDDGWFPTGDLGRMDACGLHILGRHHDLIVTGGENVYPAEVEREMERIGGVRAACVFGVSDDTWGEIVCVAVVRESDVDVDVALLGAHVGKTLAAHKRPRQIAFLDELPMNASGKVDRRRTRELALPRLAPLPKGG